MSKMGKKLRKMINILAWIALIVGIIMVIWKIFGNSPTDLQLISPFLIFGLLKIWTNNNSVRDIGYQVNLFENSIRHSFEKVSEDINKLENKMGGRK